MLKAGFDSGGICERPVGLRSVVFEGEAGAGVVEGWIIDAGRELLTDVRLVAVDVAVAVVLMLVVLECACVCGARMLDERARPLGLAWPCGSLVDVVRFKPVSAGTLRCTALAEARWPGLATPDVEEALLSFDCVWVCDLVDGARPSWLVAGVLLDNGLEVFVGGGISLRSNVFVLPFCAAVSSIPSTWPSSGSSFSLSVS